MASNTGRVRSKPQPIVPKRPPRRPSTLSGSTTPSIMLYNNAVYYVPGNKPPSSLNVEALSHIFYASANVSNLGEVSLGDEKLDALREIDGHKGCLRACKALKERNSHLKVLLSIGTREDTRPALLKIAASETYRATFAKTSKAIVEQFDLDGLDLFWDFLEPNPQETTDYAWLIFALRAVFPEGRYVLSTALPGDANTLLRLPLQRVSDYVDLLNIKCFDFSGSWSHATAHHSQLYDSTPDFMPQNSTMTCKTILTIVLVQKAVKSRKVMVGIPLYGRAFLGCTAIGQTFEGARIIPYNQLPNPGTFEDFDDKAMAVYCQGGKDGFVSYDNPTSVKVKADFIKHHHMGGLFFWEANGDTDDERSLVTAGSCCLAP